MNCHIEERLETLDKILEAANGYEEQMTGLGDQFLYLLAQLYNSPERNPEAYFYF